MEHGRRRDAAEEARTLVSSVTVGYLATVGEQGDPWCSLVVYGPTDTGDPVLLVSTMAEHGRNLLRDPRASLAINDPSAPGDPLDRPRITLAGRAVQPAGDAAEAALDAHVAAIPGARLYAGWDDFSLWILEVERVRWVGGFAVMDTVSRDEYRAAEPDPTRRSPRRPPSSSTRTTPTGCSRSRASSPARAAPSPRSARASTATGSTSAAPARASRRPRASSSTRRWRRPPTCDRRPPSSCSARRPLTRARTPDRPRCSSPSTSATRRRTSARSRRRAVEHWRFATIASSTADEIGATLRNLLELRGIGLADISASIVSSTVPTLAPEWLAMAERYLTTRCSRSAPA